MKNKNKFINELIELLYKYDLPVEDFLNLVNDDNIWVQKVRKTF